MAGRGVANGQKNASVESPEPLASAPAKRSHSTIAVIPDAGLPVCKGQSVYRPPTAPTLQACHPPRKMVAVRRLFAGFQTCWGFTV